MQALIKPGIAEVKKIYIVEQIRVHGTGGNRAGSAGSQWNRSDPLHEPVRFPP
jgi:hypothetical protein